MLTAMEPVASVLENMGKKQQCATYSVIQLSVSCYYFILQGTQNHQLNGN